MREGVEPRLAEAVAETESAYDAWAISRKGAVGVMQLMPSTAGALGVRNARNVEENVTAGVRYLKYLHWYYRGDLRLALAAYNAGPGAVAKYGGVPPYMETREYITAVLERYYGVRRAQRRPRRTVVLAGGPRVCGGSEMVRDAAGRLYVRARSAVAGCVGARER
jgi:soluble lytic murein transglycosylase-like protein